MKKRKLLIGLPLLAILLIGMMVLRPISKVSLADTERVNGIVASMEEIEQTGDISIRLQNDPNYYYINRGIQQGISLEQLKTTIDNQEITIYHPQHWTPIDPFGKNRHISRITLEEKFVYDELSE